MQRIVLFFVAVSLLSSCSKSSVNFMIQAPTEMVAPAAYAFDNQSIECDSYEWDFGDGNTSQDSSPAHTYYLSGNYEVTLKGKAGSKIKTITKTLEVKAPEKCLIMIETPYGTMMAELSEKTPKHRDNFTKLAEEGFYNDLLFHRVIKGFMIQGGDPNSRNSPAGAPLGTGGPGYLVDAEFDPSLAHTRGALATARVGGPSNPDKKSSGSQFYIVHGKPVNSRQLQQHEQRHGVPYADHIVKDYEKNGGAPFLDQDYTVFGKIVKGFDVIDKIAEVRTNRSDRPDEDVWMKIRVIK